MGASHKLYGDLANSISLSKIKSGKKRLKICTVIEYSKKTLHVLCIVDRVLALPKMKEKRRLGITAIITQVEKVFSSKDRLIDV